MQMHFINSVSETCDINFDPQLFKFSSILEKKNIPKYVNKWKTTVKFTSYTANKQWHPFLLKANVQSTQFTSYTENKWTVNKMTSKLSMRTRSNVFSWMTFVSVIGKDLLINITNTLPYAFSITSHSDPQEPSWFELTLSLI